MVDNENPKTALMELKDEDKAQYQFWDYFWGPLNWLKMLAKEMHWSFVFGVVIVYGFSQGLGGALNRVSIEYYMKDVQKVQPSEAQIYQGFTSIPWLIKPVWGLMTDVVPILGYHRRPYFIFAGVIGIVPMLYLSLHKQMHIFFAVLSLTAGSAGAAIADVTVDACVAQNSNKHQHLAPDMQSLCSLSSSTGSLLGFFLSGILVHLIGPEGVFGLLIIPSALVFLVGIVLHEPQRVNFCYQQVGQKVIDATRAMTNTLKLPNVGNLEFVGYILSIGSTGAILASLLYQYALKDYQFRNLCFWSQIFLGLSGMLDLMLVFRLNLKLGIPDHFFAVLDECAFQFVGRLKWMPLLVLSSRLCPPGIEGTFFALIMSIGNTGMFSSSWFGGMLLHILNITRTRFDNLWVAILIRNIARVSPLVVIFLVPKTEPNSSILPSNISSTETKEILDDDKIELVSLMNSVDKR
ncbi:putative folate-biopterin transporter 2 [Bienertia sinuspersici]